MTGRRRKRKPEPVEFAAEITDGAGDPVPFDAKQFEADVARLRERTAALIHYVDYREGGIIRSASPDIRSAQKPVVWRSYERPHGAGRAYRPVSGDPDRHTRAAWYAIVRFFVRGWWLARHYYVVFFAIYAVTYLIYLAVLRTL